MCIVLNVEQSNGNTSELSVQKCHSADSVQNRFQVSAQIVKQHINTTLPYLSW